MQLGQAGRSCQGISQPDSLEPDCNQVKRYVVHICFPLKEQWSTRPSSDQRWNMPALHGLVLLLPHCHSWMLSKGVLSGLLTFLRMTSSPQPEKVYFSRQGSQISHYFLCISLSQKWKFPSKWLNFPAMTLPKCPFFPTMLISHQIQPLGTRREVGALTLFHRMYYEEAPELLCQLLPEHLQLDPRLRRSVRSHDLAVQIPRSNLVSHKRSFVPSAARIWNSLPEYIPSLEKRACFKKEVNRYLGDN